MECTPAADHARYPLKSSLVLQAGLVRRQFSLCQHDHKRRFGELSRTLYFCGSCHMTCQSVRHTTRLSCEPGRQTDLKTGTWETARPPASLVPSSGSQTQPS